ncbi:MAG TPA: YihY/virulence factor BrkB family protein [Flavisolibacter sp.]|nr:YihY/virulence factor BrkB family protein [Flavisolibacter sp.]
MKRLGRMGKVFNLIGDAGSAFVEDEGFKLSASLSYYTIFALGPVLIIIISLVGIFFGRDAVQGELYLQINELVGQQAATQIQDIIKNIQESKATTAGAFIGGIVLIIGATGVFTEMQGSINFIWSVKAKPKKGWLKYLINRLISFSLIVGLGFLLLVSLIANALLTLLSDKLVKLIPNYTVSLFQFINTITMLVVITGLFTVIFKILPDAVISWTDALIGSALTATLFLLGKSLIGLYLGKANLGITYGTAASIVIILTWVYYSSVILYFGAEFTKVYALNAGEGIRPKQTAVFIIKQEAKEIPQSRLNV